MASSDPQGEVLASTENSPGAPAESPVERQTVRETGCVSDRMQTCKPPQRTEPKTYTGVTSQRRPAQATTKAHGQVPSNNGH